MQDHGSSRIPQVRGLISIDDAVPDITQHTLRVLIHSLTTVAMEV